MIVSWLVSNNTKLKMNTFTYIAPGTLTSVKLLSILYNKGSDSFPNPELVYGTQHIKLPKAANEGKGFLEWTSSDFSALLDADISKFSLNLKPGMQIQIDLDQIMPIAVEDAKPKPEEVEKVVLLHFTAGYFVRSSDFKFTKLTIPSPKGLTPSRKSNYEKSCQQYKQNIAIYNNDQQNKFSNLYQKHQAYESDLKKKRTEEYKKYQQQVSRAPKMKNEYLKDPLVDVKTPDDSEYTNLLVMANSTSSKTTQPSQAKKPMPNIQQFNSTPPPRANTQRENTFPTCQSWVGPKPTEIKEFLKELNIIFPLDSGRNTFCGVSEADPDLQAQKIFLFNVIHYLIMFAEFTGVVYDYRITLADGLYNLEDRATAVEVKKDISKSNWNSNPYREAIFNCLKKVTTLFNLKPRSMTFYSYLESIQAFADSINESS